VPARVGNDPLSALVPQAMSGTSNSQFKESGSLA
jgi:hypothetical protein